MANPATECIAEARSLNPCSVDGPAAISLALLQQNLLPPLVVVDGVHVSRSFNAHSTALSPSWRSVMCWYVDEASGIELEGWFGAESLKVDLGVGMVELNQLVQRSFARIKRYAGRIGVYNETVVRIWLCSAEHELLVRRNAREWRDLASRDAVLIGHLMQVGGQLYSCALNRGSI